MGGLWASSTSNPTAVWSGLHANISHYCMTFSDHPYTGNPAIIPSLDDVFAYIRSYIDRFKLEKHIKFNTRVSCVKYLPNKKWQVHSVNTTTNEEAVTDFDFLIVASGLHATPRMPHFENMDSFKGLLLHCSQFKLNDERLKGKNVVVIGHSFSATDMSANLVGTAATVTNIFRRPYLVTPRFIRFKSELNKNKPNSFHVVPNDFVVFRRAVFLYEPQTPEEFRAFNRKHLAQMNVEQSNKEKSHPELFYDFDVETEIRQSISDNYYGMVKRGDIRPKRAAIKRFEADGVVLEDGSLEKADAVIVCTGYDVTIDYFDEDMLKTLEYDKEHYKAPYLLYKFTFHPELENMAMICQNDGLLFTCTELQCKWASLVFSGKKELASKEIMHREISEARDLRKLNLKRQFPYGHNIVMDMLAKEANVLPDFDELKAKDPELYDMAWNK